MNLIANGRVAIDEENNIYVDGLKTGKSGLFALALKSEACVP